jgi:hypothetical protein
MSKTLQNAMRIGKLIELSVPCEEDHVNPDTVVRNSKVNRATVSRWLSEGLRKGVVFK